MLDHDYDLSIPVDESFACIRDLIRAHFTAWLYDRLSACWTIRRAD